MTARSYPNPHSDGPPREIIKAKYLNDVEADLVELSVIQHKGALMVGGDATGTEAELLVGTDGFVLTADSTQPKGLKWAVSGGAGGTEYVEDAVPSADPQAPAQVLRRRDTLSTETSADGDWTVPNVTAKGEQYVKHVDSVPVTGTFWQATQPVSGTVTANQGTAHATEKWRVSVIDALPAGTANIGDVDVLTMPAITGTVTANGDADHDATNTLKNIQIAGHASPSDVPPTLVSANGDRVRSWYDRAGASIMRRRKLRETYTAVCRLAEAASRLDPTFTFTANTNKQLVTLHHAATATREIRIHKVTVYVNLLGTAAGFFTCELRAITGTPATGNPAITPKAHRLDAAATEAVCLVLPTTGGTDATPNSPYGSFIIDHGIEATTPPTAHPLPYGITSGFPFVLYDSSGEDDELLPIILRASTLEGVAVVGRDTGAAVLRFYAIIKYTEETV